MSELRGSLDDVQGGYIRGWCAASPGDRIIIEVDGQRVGSASPRLSRSDLRAAGIGDCAFQYELPQGLFDGGDHEIRAISMLTGKLLDGSGAKFRLLSSGFSEGAPGRVVSMVSKFAERTTADRPTFLGLVPTDISALEIGPGHRPCLVGPNIRYADWLEPSQLRERARSMGDDESRTPEQIHYLGTALRDVPEKFDAVFSSHNIEHQPDLIGHLNDVADRLNPGGAFFLLCPDHRYCFDHFQSPSRYEDVLEGAGRTRHTLAAIILHRAHTTHNDSMRHWQGDHGQTVPTREAIDGAVAEYASGSYVDVHGWFFTAETFHEITHRLFAEGRTRLRPLRVYPTMQGSNEFCAVLTTG